VTGVLHPLGIFVAGLGGGFLIPLAYRLGRSAATGVFLLALAAMTVISGVALCRLLMGAAPIEILTGGAAPPIAINLRMGLPEAGFAFSVNLVALIGAGYFAREKYGVMLLYLLLVMGVQGMVMTRDLFNLFVFLEIVSIATYGLLSLGENAAALSATFKYLMATILASTFFLIGTALLYAASGLLNIDDLIAARASLSGPIGFAGLMFLLAALLLELKPFPANGWGLDAYETARPDVAALISGVVSAGVFFALMKLLPLFESQLDLIASLSAITFLASNLLGLAQTKARRLLGYSSIGQMALLTLAACLLQKIGVETSTLRLVVGGLFLNHLFAKVGLFWLSRHVSGERLEDWSALAGPRGGIVLFAILLGAIAGFPPFPGFWAKWRLVLSLASDQRYLVIGVVLIGSLLEAAYLFRWFGQIVHSPAPENHAPPGPSSFAPALAMALLLAASGCLAASLAGLSSVRAFAPLAAGLVLYPLDRLDARFQQWTAFALTLAGGFWLIHDLTGIGGLYAAVLFAGVAILSIACAYRTDRRPGFYPLLTVMLLSLVALPGASTRLEFFFVWELITLSSYFLILRRGAAQGPALRYLLFSVVAAYFLLAGFALVDAAPGADALVTLHSAGPERAAVAVLLAIGLLIKAGAVGVHVWLPGAYAESDDDISALLSAVVSKAPMFGLLIMTYLAVRSNIGLDMANVVCWIGMLTTLAGALLAAQQDDIKRMLAYSSMSQIGYIIAAISLVSHLGWVTALYLVANHMLVKGVLFLAAAAIILRTGRRRLSELGGLARAMPFTFAAAAVAIIAMSGLPPLAGFGGKWLLLNAMLERGWYGSAIATLFATFVGFTYMARFIQTIFFGLRPSVSERTREAPIALLAPQYLCVAGILLMSFLPKLLIEPISRAINPQFASTLVWQGMSLETIYGYWNPTPVMALSLVVAAILFAALWLLRRLGWPEGKAALRVPFYEWESALFSRLTPPWASAFWGWTAGAAMTLSERARAIYSGDPQTYSLYVLCYVLAVYALGGGLGRFLSLG
jgi:formate hydrogenlyase subunit 3/multisubunit Na+/H+ antiporter MnhD subunit